MPFANEAEKLTFLELIKQKKDTLFSPLHTEFAKVGKTSAWQEIIEKCIDIHGFSPLPTGKDWTYARDTIWPYYRSNTIKKRERKRKIGTNADSCRFRAKFSKIDDMVLDIIGSQDNQTIEELIVENGVDLLPPEACSSDWIPVEKAEFDTIDEQIRETLYGNDNNDNGVAADNQLLVMDELKRKKLELEIREIELRCINWQLQNEKLRVEINLLRSYSTTTLPST